MARSLQELVGAQDAGDVSPLLANEAFRRRADLALQDADTASLRAAQAASVNEDYAGIVRMFAAAKRSLREIAKRYPEAARHTGEAALAVDRAMACVVGDDPSRVVPGTVTNAPARPAGTPPSPFVRR